MKKNKMDYSHVDYSHVDYAHVDYSPPWISSLKTQEKSKSKCLSSVPRYSKEHCIVLKFSGSGWCLSDNSNTKMKISEENWWKNSG
jgi:hypothetical protein